MKTALTQTLNTVEWFFGIIIDIIFAFFDSFQKQNGLKAEFASERIIASRFNKGFVISKHRRLSRKKSYENLLLSGQIGSGKTTKLLVKNLLSLKNCSMVVNDPSKELYHLTSGYLSQFFTIKTLNFSDSSKSSGYNILSSIKKTNDINKVAHLLVSATLNKGNSDPFWQLQSQSLIQFFIRLVLEQPNEYHNIANVHHFLNTFSASSQTIDKWVVKTNNQKLIADYKAIIATPEKTLLSIAVTAKAALQLFEDEEIIKTTAHTTIDLDELRKKPTIIFLHGSISHMRYISTLNAIFFEQLYGHVLQELPKKDDLDLFIILEEASSLYIPLLNLALANCRKFRVSTLVCVQSTTQLDTLYKSEAEDIIGNCVTKLYLPGETSVKVLRGLETLSGKCIYYDENKKERTKPLITMEEIRMLPENRTLLISGNLPFIKGRSSPYFRSLKFRLRASIPPLPLKGDLPDGEITLLQ
jgi:type IV secretion system protein VirD4